MSIPAFGDIDKGRNPEVGNQMVAALQEFAKGLQNKGNVNRASAVVAALRGPSQTKIEGSDSKEPKEEITVPTELVQNDLLGQKVDEVR